jgi:hypothetical protein
MYCVLCHHLSVIIEYCTHLDATSCIMMGPANPGPIPFTSHVGLVMHSVRCAASRKSFTGGLPSSLVLEAER